MPSSTCSSDACSSFVSRPPSSTGSESFAKDLLVGQGPSGHPVASQVHLKGKSERFELRDGD